MFDLLSQRAGRSGRPAVLLGDLNLEGAVVGPIAAARGFDLAVAPPTYPAARPTRRIDHVALRGLRLEAVEVPAARASDHRPLLVRCSLESLNPRP